MTDSDILVSIIVPVYGTEAYLPACIESICNQTYKNIQIILVDDQSPDSCPELCDEYAQRDSRILVIHQKNKGVSGARNTGLNYALGEYIMFVDSDDELFPSATELLIQDAQKYGADIVSATKRVKKRNLFTNTGEDGICTVWREEETLLRSLNGDGNTNSACAKLFRADMIQNIRFVEGHNINEDGFFLFQCFLKKPVFVQHNVAIYQYNTRPGSGSRQAFSDKYLSMLYFCERKKEIISAKYPQYMDQMHNAEVHTNLQLLDVLCRTTDKKYKAVQRQCIDTVRRLYQHHKPINDHYKKLAWLVVHRLYPFYKWAVRMKYYR